MSPDHPENARYLLRKALTLYGRDLAARHPWMRESDRWKELVFALLVQISSMPESRVRQLVGHLDELYLLDIDALANICTTDKLPDLTTAIARQFLDFAQENGFSQSEAERALAATCQAALAFQTHYEGKPQRYLRSYGENMLNDLGGIFEFSSLTEIELRNAFTYWFQNALNMPLSLVDEHMHEYCRAHELTPSRLIDAADDVGLNLALLDDLMALWVNNHPRNDKPAQTG